MYSYRNRWYLPEAGVFGERDPEGHRDSVNMYSSLRWAPNSWIDPYGSLSVVVAYGQGWLDPILIGRDYDVGDQFKLAALTRVRELKRSAEIQNLRLRDSGVPAEELLHVEAPELVSDREEFIDFLTRPREYGPIAVLEVFSHAWSGGLNFGGHPGDTAVDWRVRNFTITDIDRIPVGTFSQRAVVRFYGCHTADSVSASGREALERNFKSTQSFAEEFSRRTGTLVTGFICGSHFQSGPGGELHQVPDNPNQRKTFERRDPFACPEQVCDR